MMLHVTRSNRRRRRVVRFCRGSQPFRWSLDGLTRLREQFLAVYFGLPQSEVSFAERNTAIAAASERPEVILWFGHALFDQLQLLQVRRARRPGPPSSP